ncbi:MAG TPA: hypothetical protein VEO56_15040 [Bacteroidota bacterium]|nr:hypothetical protein [Bacteroidota bacterium]
MKSFQEILTACVIAISGASSAGCSLIGYAIGNAADHDKYAIDSLSFCHPVKGSPEFSVRPADSTKLANMLQKAALGQDVVVTVVTTRGTHSAACVTADTVVVLRNEGPGGEELLPGELVTLVLNDSGLTRVSGRVRRLKQGAIVISQEGASVEYPFGGLSEISLNDKTVVTREEFSSPQFSDRFTRLPVLVLRRNGPDFCVPLREVVFIQVAKQETSATGRIIGFGIGLCIDIPVVYEIVSSFKLFPGSMTFNMR